MGPLDNMHTRWQSALLIYVCIVHQVYSGIFRRNPYNFTNLKTVKRNLNPLYNSMLPLLSAPTEPQQTGEDRKRQRKIFQHIWSHNQKFPFGAQRKSKFSDFRIG